MGHVQSSTPTPQPQPVPVAPDQADQVTEQQWAIHGQTALVWANQPSFRSPYQGEHSLPVAANSRETFDLTIYGGWRPWQGGEI